LRRARDIGLIKREFSLPKACSAAPRGCFNERMTDATPPPPPHDPSTNPYAAPPQPLSPSDERLWATLVHVGGIFFSFVPALIGYLVLKDRGPLVRAHTLTALNFQLTVLIAWVVAGILTFVLIGYLLYPVIAIVEIIFSIIAAVAANKGEPYSYPLSIKFIR
jgi:uncharacterized Tic20 family protein